MSKRPTRLTNEELEALITYGEQFEDEEIDHPLTKALSKLRASYAKRMERRKRELIKVFVYGTLKKGYNNHHYLSRGARFIGEAYTVDRYSMIHVGFPVILNSGDERFPVTGELYEIDARGPVLKNLDRLEGEGRMYNRVKASVMVRGGEEVEASYYVGHPDAWAKRDGTPVAEKDGAITWAPYPPRHGF